MKFLYKLPLFAPTLGTQVCGKICKDQHSGIVPRETREWETGRSSGIVQDILKRTVLNAHSTWVFTSRTAIPKT